MPSHKKLTVGAERPDADGGAASDRARELGGGGNGDARLQDEALGKLSELRQPGASTGDPRARFVPAARLVTRSAGVALAPRPRQLSFSIRRRA